MQVQDDKPYDDINITPMLDLAYVLLVIFILMCTASVQGLKANLPRGGAAPKTPSKTKVQSIQVTGDNRFQLNGKDVSIEQLQSQLAQAKAQNSQMQVVLKGESATHYASVVQVLHVISQLEIKQVGLATKATKAK
jgi:biopolymer transport protein ExbD